MFFLFATKSCIVMRTGRPAKQWMGLVIEALALRNQKKASRSKGILGAGESRIRPAKKLFSGGLPMGGQAHSKRLFFSGHNILLYHKNGLRCETRMASVGCWSRGNRDGHSGRMAGLKIWRFEPSFGNDQHGLTKSGSGTFPGDGLLDRLENYYDVAINFSKTKTKNNEPSVP